MTKHKLSITGFLLLACFSTNQLMAKNISKGGGYNLCRAEVLKTYAARDDGFLRTRLIKVKHTPRNRSKQGVTHRIQLKVTGAESEAFKVDCVVNRNGEDYTAAISRP